MITIKKTHEVRTEYNLTMNTIEAKTLRDALSTSINNYKLCIRRMEKSRDEAGEADKWEKYSDLQSDIVHLEDEVKRLETFRKALNLFL